MKIEITDKWESMLTMQYPVLIAAKEAISEVMGVSIEDIRSSCRMRPFVMARAIFAHLCYQRVAPDYMLASYMNRQHTALTYYINTYKGWQGFDKTFTNICDRTEEVFNKKIKEYDIRIWQEN